MMMMTTTTSKILRRMTLVGLMGLVGCSDDGEAVGSGPRAEAVTLTVVPYASSFMEVREMSNRALPTGYVNYNTLYPATLPEHTTIGIFPTQAPSTTPAQSVIRLKENAMGERHWESTITIADGTQYYFYGFMPTEAAAMATVSPLDDDSYAHGADMTISGLSTLTPADICAVVGVAKTSDPANIEEVDLKLGHFGYLGSPSDNNYIFLLLKHLYAGLHFKTHLDADYAKLRTIKITKMTLETFAAIHDKVNLHIKLQANAEGADPVKSVDYEDAGTEQIASTVLYDAGSSEGITVPVQTTESFLGCFAPNKCHKFVLESKYNVYDKQGNLIRKDCTARNTLDFTLIHDIYVLEAGDIYTLDLKIQPTYLYVLSEPDLDSPSFVIE